MSGQLNTSYIDPETGVETPRNPQAIALEYTDPMGRRQTGYSIGNRMYKDEAGTQRIENGSLVTNASGTQTWVMTENGGVELQEYMNGQGGGQSAPGQSGTNYLSDAKNSALNAASKRTEAGIASLEAQRPEIEREYREVNRQNYQGYMQSREGLANSLASQGLYNSGYSDSAQIAQTAAYRERSNANALERVRALRELERQITVARLEGSAALSELEAQYQRLMQEQWNADRAYNYQAGRDAIADARYGKEWEHQLERESVSDLQWEREFTAAQAAVEFEKELALKEAKSAEEQRAIENAYQMGLAGDVSRLKELGMDTSYLERLLDLEAQQLYQSVYGSSGYSGGGYTGGGAKTPEQQLYEADPIIYAEVLGYAKDFLNNQADTSLDQMLSLLDGNYGSFQLRYGDKADEYYALYRDMILANHPAVPGSNYTAPKPTYQYGYKDLFDGYYNRLYNATSTPNADGSTTKGVVYNPTQAQNVVTEILTLYTGGEISETTKTALIDGLGLTELYKATAKQAAQEYRNDTRAQRWG